jgi:hypothetical protein
MSSLSVVLTSYCRVVFALNVKKHAFCITEVCYHTLNGGDYTEAIATSASSLVVVGSCG